MHIYTLGRHPQHQEVKQAIPLIHSGGNKSLVGNQGSGEKEDL